MKTLLINPLYVTALLLLALFFTNTSLAALVSGPDIIMAPSSVIDDSPGAENTNQQAFNERQHVILPNDISVDGGIISSGTLINSHMIFLNTPSITQVSTLNIEWAFDGKILGVMSDVSGVLESNSNSVLGAIGTTYPGSLGGRGLEGNDIYSVFDNTITISMIVSEPGDWVRVVTAVPIPAALWLFMSGLVSISCFRKIKSPNRPTSVFYVN